MQKEKMKQGCFVEYVYDANGSLVDYSGTWSGQFAYGGAFGYQSDDDSGLMLLGHRYYDASTGRFLSRDPVGDGSNWYVYCGNNPVSHADIEGFSPTIIIWAAKRVIEGNIDRVRRTMSISHGAAVKRRLKGKNVLVTSSKNIQEAQRVAKEIEDAVPGKTKHERIPHGGGRRGYYPHYQTPKIHGHTWYTGPRPRTGWRIPGGGGSGGGLGAIFVIGEGSAALAEGVAEVIKWRKRIQAEIDEMESEAMREFANALPARNDASSPPLLEPKF